MASSHEQPSFYVSVAGHTDVGRVRQKNEDAFTVVDLTGGNLLDGASHARFNVGERGVLLAVSDGMGGAEAGEVASALVLETLTRALAKAPPETPRDKLMTDAIQRAHQAVFQLAQRESKKMGATLTTAFVHAGQAFIAEVGDSRAYLVRAGQITQLTHDQSLVQALVDSGALNAEEAGESQMRNVILQAMGHQPEVKVALAKLELRDRDCLVLCSDGLTIHVSDEEIRDAVLACRRPQEISQRLVALANDRGGKDNITVLVAGIGGALDSVKPDETVDDTFEVLSTFEAPFPKG
jgi:serine/threonine protein phosphatase PrpC